MATTAFCSDRRTIICFSTGQWPNTSRLCKGYLTKKESDGVLHQMTWPPQSPDRKPIEMVWDELDRRVKCSDYVGTPSRMLDTFSWWSWFKEGKECAKLSSRQRVATLKNLTSSNIKYLDLLDTFLVTTWFHMCYFIVLISSLLFYNVENSTNKEKPLNE